MAGIPVRERIERARNALAIKGCTFPKKAGVLREEHKTIVDPTLAKVKTQVTYSLTTEQYVFVKNRGGSAFLRDLISWFAAQEAKAISNAVQGNGTGAFSFNGYPVLMDIDAQKPMWETYYWAKEHNYKASQLDEETAAKQQ